MNQLVDLATAYESNKCTGMVLGIDNFLNECVMANKEEIIKAISKMKKYDSVFIIETFAYRILAGIFCEKSQIELLEIIAGGSLFKIKDKLLEVFFMDHDINELLSSYLM